MREMPFFLGRTLLILHLDWVRGAFSSASENKPIPQTQLTTEYRKEERMNNDALKPTSDYLTRIAEGGRGEFGNIIFAMRDDGWCRKALLNMPQTFDAYNTIATTLEILEPRKFDPIDYLNPTPELVRHARELALRRLMVDVHHRGKPCITELTDVEACQALRDIEADRQYELRQNTLEIVRG